MIEIERTEVYGWESAIHGMRNPMNSWKKSDSDWFTENKIAGYPYDDGMMMVFDVGSNDLALMKHLVKAGTDHSKFMRMIVVTCDIIAPLYWWKEFDTYKVGTVRNSCSTMQKIHSKEFALDDFSHEHLLNESDVNSGDKVYEITLEAVIIALNDARSRYLNTHDKKYWWQMIQLLPSSYNQKATVQMNYQVLRNMYHGRKNHKLDEWKEFCDWIESLPYSELITE